MTDFGRRHNGMGGGRVLAAALAALFALWSPQAHARLGEGFKVGPGRLRLGLELNARYDTMAIVRPNGGTDGDGIGLARGSFLLDVPGQNVKINISGGIDWNQYLSLTTSTSNAPFSFFGANVLGAATINPGGQVGLDLTENLSRSDHTTNPLFTSGVLAFASTTKARVWGKPGGGALEFGAGYELGIDAYSPQVSADVGSNYKGELCTDTSDPACSAVRAAAYNGLLNRVAVDAKWRLLPKTGLTFDASYGWKTYQFAETADGTESAQPIRAMLGFGTLLSTRTTFAVRLGYGGILFKSSPMRNNVLAQAEAGYRVTETLSARLGFSRSDEPVAGKMLFYSDNRVYADFRGQFNRVVASAMASLDFIGYGPESLTNPNPRQDMSFGLSGTLDYNFTDWLRLTTRAGLSTRSASGVQNAAAYAYNRWEFALGAATLF